MMTARTEISLDSIVALTEDHVSCELGGEVVVLSFTSGEYYGLNPVAAAVWTQLQSPRTVLDLRDHLLEEFTGVTPEDCLDQLAGLILELAEMKLVSVG